MADTKVAKSTKKGGRVKGTPNKKTQDVIDRLKELKCDPIEGMAKIADTAYKDGDLPLAGQMYKELAQYVAPKRKAVEISSDSENPLTISLIERTIVKAKD